MTYLGWLKISFTNNTNYYGKKKTPKNRKADRKTTHIWASITMITNPVRLQFTC